MALLGDRAARTVLREAELGKTVERDDVVRCFDCDALMVEGHRQHFLVMEYVERQTLRDLLIEASMRNVMQ